METKIRNCNLEDLNEICNIYNYYVLNSTCTMDYEVSTESDFIEKWSVIRSSPFDSFIVAEIVDNKEENLSKRTIIGYAYTTAFRPKIGYRFTREITIYVHNDFIHFKVGQRLLDEIEHQGKQRGAQHLIATIESSNMTSIQFFTKNLYTQTSFMENITVKFGQLCSIVMMQKLIAQK